MYNFFYTSGIVLSERPSVSFDFSTNNQKACNITRKDILERR